MARTKKPTMPVCVWRFEEDGYYDTGCGRAFVLNDGTPSENEMRFCCYCGGRLKVGAQEPKDG